MRFSPILIALVGCATVEQTFEDTASSEGVWVVNSRSERGDLAYYGTSPRETFTIAGTSWGKGKKRRATDREATNTYVAEVVGATLYTTVDTDFRKAGVDMSVTGPRVMDLDLETLDGTIDLDSVEGVSVLTGSRVFGTNLVGDYDIYADWRGVDVDIWPYENGRIVINSNGDDVFLALPYGLEYDINVIGDPDYGMDVVDLGFSTLGLDSGFLIAQTGRGTIQIDVFVTGGSFTLWESLQTQPY